MHYLRTHAGQDGMEWAWQTGRAGGKQAEDALPGWSCLCTGICYSMVPAINRSNVEQLTGSYCVTDRTIK